MSNLKYYHTRVTKTGRNAIRARSFTELYEVSRLSRDRKAMNANADVLPPLKLFAEFRMKSSGFEVPSLPSTIHLSDILEGKTKISFAGLLRALVALKAYNPAAFEFFIEVARLLSVQVDDRFVKYPPALYQACSVHPYFDEVWRRLTEKYGFTADDYLKGLCQMLLNGNCQDVLENVAFFSPVPKEDLETIEQWAKGTGESADRDQVACSEGADRSDRDSREKVVASDVRFSEE